MSYNANNIIQINTAISPDGLGFANFAKAVIFAPESELPVGFDTDTYRDYSDLSSLGADFASATETYKAANRWLGGIPATREVTIYAVDDLDANWTDTLNKARNQLWWFWTMVTAPVYASTVDATAVADWCNSNRSFFINNQTGAAATAIRDPGDGGIAAAFTTAGYRFAYTFAHATDPYAGNALAKWFAAVNYSIDRSTITGEYKVLSGVDAESLTTTEYNAMKQDTTKAVFYTPVDLQGSQTGGRVINSLTHSAFGEFIDDVVNLEAFVNALKVELFNVIQGQPRKLGQDVGGQATLLGTARSVCEQYVANGYLGPRNFLDPDDGQEKFVPGYQILTTAEEILSISDALRDGRKAAPIRVRIFRRGAIHAVDVNVDVY